MNHDNDLPFAQTKRLRRGFVKYVLNNFYFQKMIAGTKRA